GLSRRDLLAGLGIATGAATVLASLPGMPVLPVGAQGGLPPLPQSFLPQTAGLTYILIDPSAFIPIDGAGTRNVDDTAGTRLSAPGQLRASIALPKDAVIKQVNFTYQGSPVVSLQRKPFAGTKTEVVSRVLNAGGGGFQSDNFTVDELADGTASYAFNVN